MSTLRVNTLQNTAGTGQPAMVGAAKAWVNFNGTGTVAIRAAFNVSSITDGGVGLYTVNFTTNMPDVNYAVNIAAQETAADAKNGFLQIRGGGTYSTSAVQINSGVINAFLANDSAIICVSVFR